MNNTPKTAADKSKPANPQSTVSPVPKPKPPPLFRKLDWLALLIAFAGVWIVYLLTLAPELTLEDSGELCTGSFYAGIPHPPGYPFWALYSWLWTVLVPFGNVAWRVEVGESFGAAMACGLVALMVSRGSSMLIEGIESLKDLDRKAENAICVVCGSVAGLLLGFGYTMWSESVAINRISLFGVPWMMAVAACLLRWIHAPQQRRYLYTAMFLLGISTTIHQTLLIAAIAVPFGVAFANQRMGRAFCLGYAICFFLGLIAYVAKISTGLADMDPMFKVVFWGVGLMSISGYIVLAVLTKETPSEFYVDASLAAGLLLLACSITGGAIYMLLACCAFASFVWFTVKTWKLGHEPIALMICGALVVLGASFYLYEPISGMTNPPMEWGYPRTVEGWFHALSRGQYEKAHPTDLFSPDGRTRFISQLGFLFHGIAEEFNWLLLFVAFIPLCFILRVQKRERAWLAFLVATYLCIGLLLVIIMNPGDDRSSVDLHRVFFASSHGLIAILIGYGMALIAAWMVKFYGDDFRRWGMLGGGVAAIIAVGALWEVASKYYLGPGGQIPLSQFPKWIAFAFGPNHAGLPVYGGLILIALPLVFIVAMQFWQQRAPLALTLGLFSVLPLYSVMCNWGPAEQRNHWFGYWFGHDMFTPPFGVYPEMTRNAILFGGTDPGRFCPTYMIFCESFIPHKDQPAEDQKFDRRDVYIITQNALADNTYLEYIRAQYNRSTQIDPPFFQELLRSTKEKELNYTTNLVARIAYKVLDEPLTKFGKRVEDRRRAEGVYPPKEIYIPTLEDSARCFQEYYRDAEQRAVHDQTTPNEPRQVKPGEDIRFDKDSGKLSIQGQVAVMSINGLLTKVIFDHNPSNEFFVEESFPLDWMYPYLSPFGIIMKINRQPVEVMGEDIVKKDHDFWSRYSERTVGNWITYDTPVKQICDFALQVYQDHDYTGFTGNPRFIRDDQAQKAFSKLRSSIGGIYDYRASHPNSKDPAEQQRMIREADFAYRQSFAYCPYSPEAVVRYVQLLVRTGRIDDAVLVAQTCFEFDPNNTSVESLLHQLQDMKKGTTAQPPSLAQIEATLKQMEKQVHDHPDDFQAAFNLAEAYRQLQRTNNAIQTLDGILSNPKVNENAVVTVAKFYSQMNNFPKLESALEVLTRVNPNSPEAWYDFAAIKAFRNKTNELYPALRQCMEENAKRLAKDPKALDLAAKARTDPAFHAFSTSQEFKDIVK